MKIVAMATWFRTIFIILCMLEFPVNFHKISEQKSNPFKSDQQYYFLAAFSCFVACLFTFWKFWCRWWSATILHFKHFYRALDQPVLLLSFYLLCLQESLKVLEYFCPTSDASRYPNIRRIEKKMLELICLTLCEICIKLYNWQKQYKTTENFSMRNFCYFKRSQSTF